MTRDPRLGNLFEEEARLRRLTSDMLREQGMNPVLGETEATPWKSLYVYEELARRLAYMIEEHQTFIRRYGRLLHPHVVDRFELYAASMAEVLRILQQAQVIHLRRAPLRELYERQHAEQPYEETLQLPFDSVFLEFSEPLTVKAGPMLGTDELVGMLCHEFKPHKGYYWLVLFWRDYERTDLTLKTDELPLFHQARCNLGSRPAGMPRCFREQAESLDQNVSADPMCPGYLNQSGEDKEFFCIHNAWRAQALNLFINIINLLNAKNLIVETIETPKKRITRSAKQGIQLPREYRRVDLNWFTPLRKSTESRGEGTRGPVTRPYIRRGHFRQYKPGKYVWVTSHICRADLMTEQTELMRRVYLA